ncbi:hypothetical protein N1030_14535 [Desulfovibrio mangrovi]|uniref:tetratricopeptide repeat protein n=1 Tax=Desulfovibrio mangrovi TaxID=2976983 RepID=UPI002247BE21|nr:hypothetical protein [Desulfovibrio mangrovi]UZP66814.1 hypothetical protein N1030_14535 [Desulfovibrio mangrovi]
MDSGGKMAKEHLARAKAYFQRHDVMRALEAVVNALQIMQRGITGPDKTAADSALREMVAQLNRTEEISSRFPKGIPYKPGVEKQLHAVFNQLLQSIRMEQERESYTQTLERKQKLDRLLNYGRKLLEAGKVQDAEGAFQEAVECYVDEHAMFRMMGEACLAVKQPRMAAKYLKQAVKVDKDRVRVGQLLVRALEESGNIPAARKMEAELKLS